MRHAIVFLVLVSFLVTPTISSAADPRGPDSPVRLVFVHHSTGENWLADENGGLARELQRNNYFVSDTNYGWGPDAIGDRTDIPNWPEWFTGPKSKNYMSALFAHGEVMSPYERTLPDPGGENRIVMFKSCFPNSNLEGRPGDPPRPGDGLTVGGAKAVYIDLLRYFATRPDKLFIAVTAPPVQDKALSANARAFNSWLTSEWLKGYSGRNVAVFDFYNVLTGKDNHHRLINNRIEYTADKSRNTLAYPSARDDDHPNEQGNRKAVAEFVPLLNHYYSQWIETAPAPAVSAPAPAPAPTPAQQPAQVEAMPGKPPAGNVLDDFEGDGSNWAAYRDESMDSRIEANVDPDMVRTGKQALRMDFDVARESWATCSLIYESARDFSQYKGLALYVHSDKPGRTVIVTAHGGTPDNLSHFEYQTRTTKDSVKGWQRIEAPWKDFHQPEWEDGGKARLNPAAVAGIALVFVDENGQRNQGRLWIDDLELLK